MAEPATIAVDEATNLHLHGPFAPVHDEIDAADLPVRGALPTRLAGTYLRNGPNPQFRPIGSYTYPFDGDGMVHAVKLAAGRARYRNRWVVTRGLAAERHAGRALYGGTFTPVPVERDVAANGGEPGPFKNWSNTALVRHAGVLLSLWEGGKPYQLTDGLGTVGEHDFDGALPGAMCAHPKIDPVWDELCWFRYDVDPPYLVFGVVDPRGAVSRTVQIDIPRPVLMHDFALTDQHVVFFDCPVLLDPGAPATGAPRAQWRPQHGTRIGVMPRDGGSGDLRWFPVDNRYVSHVMNAYTDGERVIVDVVQRDAFDPAAGGHGPDGSPRLQRITIDLERGIVTDEVLDNRIVDMPRIDERRTGLRYRYGYAAALTRRSAGAPSATAGTFDALVRYDFAQSRAVEFRFPEGVAVGEPMFVPDPDGTGEDAGWVLAFTYDTAHDTSELAVFEASEVAAGPIAAVAMPQRVPAGLHGIWLPAA